MFERALALDPHSASAQSWLALTLANRVINQMSDTTSADIARAEGLVGQALASSPRGATVHFAKGEVLRAQRRYADAIPEYEMVLALDRNLAWGLYALGHCKLMTGSIEEVILLIKQAIRLSPRDPQIAVMYYRIGQVHLLQSRPDEAVVWLERARNHTPTLPLIRSYLAAAYALKGETERAAVELAEARRLSSDDRFSSLARLETSRHWGVPSIRALFESTYLRGLRLAGMPEE
jgi:tetratricopeptide (TPR) repeat protein